MSRWFALSLVLAGCSQANASGDVAFQAAPLETVASASGQLRVEVHVPAGEPARGTNAALFVMSDVATGARVDGLALSVVPWMPAHAHGASVSPTVAPTGPGEYTVRNIDFFMPGSWQLRVAISGARTDSVTADLEVP